MNTKNLRVNIKKICEISLLKTIYLNFKYFSLKIAIRFPIIASRRLRIRSAKGKIILNGAPKTGRIQLGFDNVGIFDNRRSRSIWEVNDGSIIFNGHAVFGNGFKVCVGNGGKLAIGNEFHMTAESTIICYKEIEFGDNNLLSWDILVMDSDFHKIYDSCDLPINNPSKIVFGDNVWIGCRTTILKGVSVADNIIIAAGSLITKSLDESYSIYGGQPTKILKSNVRWIP